MAGIDFNYYDASKARDFNLEPMQRAAESSAAGMREAAAQILTGMRQKSSERAAASREAASQASEMARTQAEISSRTQLNAADIASREGMNKADIASREGIAGQERGVQAFGHVLNFMGDAVRANATTAREDAIVKAKAEAEALKQRNFAGAGEAASRLTQDNDYNPIVQHSLRAVDADPALASVFGEGGEPGLIAHYKERGMDDAQASQAAKAAMKPRSYEYLDENRSSRAFGLLADKFGPDAAEYAMKQRFGSTKYKSAMEVESAARGEFDSSMQREFPGRAPGAGGEKKNRIDIPGAGDMEDYAGLKSGGDWSHATPAQRAQADWIAEAQVARDPRADPIKNDHPVDRDALKAEARGQLLTTLGWKNVEPKAAPAPSPASFPVIGPVPTQISRFLPEGVGAQALQLIKDGKRDEARKLLRDAGIDPDEPAGLWLQRSVLTKDRKKP